MLEIFGKAIISFIEKEMVEAAPHLEQLLLEQVGSLVEMLDEFIGVKAASLAAPKADEAPAQVEHE